jgi:hypothetical protein
MIVQDTIKYLSPFTTIQMGKAPDMKSRLLSEL